MIIQHDFDHGQLAVLVFRPNGCHAGGEALFALRAAFLPRLFVLAALAEALARDAGNAAAHACSTVRICLVNGCRNGLRIGQPVGFGQLSEFMVQRVTRQQTLGRDDDFIDKQFERCNLQFQVAHFAAREHTGFGRGLRPNTERAAQMDGQAASAFRREGDLSGKVPVPCTQVRIDQVLKSHCQSEMKDATRYQIVSLRRADPCWNTRRGARLLVKVKALRGLRLHSTRMGGGHGGSDEIRHWVMRGLIYHRFAVAALRYWSAIIRGPAMVDIGNE